MTCSDAADHGSRLSVVTSPFEASLQILELPCVAVISCFGLGRHGLRPTKVDSAPDALTTDATTP